MTIPTVYMLEGASARNIQLLPKQVIENVTTNKDGSKTVTFFEGKVDPLYMQSNFGDIKSTTPPLVKTGPACKVNVKFLKPSHTIVLEKYETMSPERLLSNNPHVKTALNKLTKDNPKGEFIVSLSFIGDMGHASGTWNYTIDNMVTDPIGLEMGILPHFEDKRLKASTAQVIYSFDIGTGRHSTTTVIDSWNMDNTSYEKPGLNDSPDFNLYAFNIYKKGTNGFKYGEVVHSSQPLVAKITTDAILSGK